MLTSDAVIGDIVHYNYTGRVLSSHNTIILVHIEQE